MGIICSLGHSCEEFFRGLDAARAEVAPAPWSAEEGFENSWSSMVQGFRAEDWMDARVAAGSDPFAQYAMAAAVQAVEEIGVETLDPLRTAVVMGTSMAGCQSLAASQHGLDSKGPSGVSRKLQLEAWPNMAAAQIALRWKLHGPLLTISTACASSIDAIGMAARMIETGTADVAIAGGCDAARCELVSVSARLYGMTVSEPDPLRVCLPFDVNRAGIMGGEGAGVVVLEDAERARARGARILGRVRGYASLSDAYHPSSPDPSAEWEIWTMERAIAEAGFAGGAAAIDAVVAHGTGTRVGDAAEIRAINHVFRERRDPLRVASIKGHVGHTGGAAGVMGLQAALHSMRQEALVPTAGTRDVDPAAEFHVVTREPAPGPIGAAQVNGFGFGGQNASLVVTRT